MICFNFGKFNQLLRPMQVLSKKMSYLHDLCHHVGINREKNMSSAPIHDKLRIYPIWLILQVSSSK